jgi:hypothetical protein
MTTQSSELRALKRRTGIAEERVGIAEEAVRVKKERLADAEQDYEDEHRTFTVFSKGLEDKWEQRYDALAELALEAGVTPADVSAIRMRPWQSAIQPQSVAQQTTQRAERAEEQQAVEPRAEEQQAEKQQAERAEEQQAEEQRAEGADGAAGRVSETDEQAAPAPLQPQLQPQPQRLARQSRPQRRVVFEPASGAPISEGQALISVSDVPIGGYVCTRGRNVVRSGFAAVGLEAPLNMAWRRMLVINRDLERGLLRLTDPRAIGQVYREHGSDRVLHCDLRPEAYVQKWFPSCFDLLRVLYIASCSV